MEYTKALIQGDRRQMKRWKDGKMKEGWIDDKQQKGKEEWKEGERKENGQMERKELLREMKSASVDGSTPMCIWLVSTNWTLGYKIKKQE